MTDRDTLRTLIDGLLTPPPPALVDPDAMAAILSMAADLAPVFCGGIECRLAADAPRVDLHQCIGADNHQPGILAAHIRRHPTLSVHPQWSALASFCDAWDQSGSPLARCVDELWLELDSAGAASPIPTPAVFASLGRVPQTNASAPDAFAAVQAMSRILDSPIPPAAISVARRMPAGTRITHVGLMMSRPGHPLRLNLAGMPPDRVTATLAAVGWPGDPGRVEPLLAALAPLVSGFIVCLDVGDAVSPQLGVECPAPDGYGPLLDALTVRGLCDPKKAEALSCWALAETPSANLPWPATVIRQALLLAPDRFVQLNRDINHIKVVLSPERVWSAKAYLWFGDRAITAPGRSVATGDEA